MILVIHYRDGHDKTYRLTNDADMDKLIESFPSLSRHLMFCRTEDESAKVIGDVLERLHLTYDLHQSDLYKSFGKRLGVGLGLMTAVASHEAQLPKNKPIEPPRQVASVHDTFGSAPEDSFLWNIKQIESSGGQNTHHKPVTTGVNKGATAIGKWGLMPNTIREVAKRVSKTKIFAPGFQHLSGLDDANMKDVLEKNPELELKVARQLAKHVLGRHQGNKRKAAYSWLYGHNLSPHQITDSHLSDPYVQRFDYFEKINPLKSQNKLAGMQKSESLQEIPQPDEFQKVVGLWLKIRHHDSNVPMTTSSWSPDPGRIRDDEAIEPPTDKDILKDYLAYRSKK